MKNIIRFTSTVLAALALTGTLFYALAFDKRMDLDQASYLIVQKSFPGTNFVLLIEVLTVVLTAIWMYSERQTYRRFYTLLGATICFAISLTLFFFFILPANRQTHGWTQLTDSWTSLRDRWEYAQLARGICNLAGISLIVTHLLIRKGKGSKTKYPGRQY